MKKILCGLVLAGSAFMFAMTSFAEVTSGQESATNWDIIYPIVSIAEEVSAQDAVNADLDNYREQLRDDFQNGKYYICNERYMVHYEDNDILSISIYQLRQPYGGNGNHTKSFDLVYDKHTGARIPLENYVHVTKDDLVEYKWGHSYDQRGNLLKSDWLRASDIKSVPDNYFLMGDGVVCIVFQPYRLTSGASGCCYIKLEPDYIEYLNRKNQ